MHREKRHIFSLVLILTVASLLTGSISALVFYRTAIQEKSSLLLTEVQNLARLISAVAKFDRGTFANPAKAAQATLSQVQDAFRKQEAVGETGEIMLGRKEDKKIIIFLRYRDHQINDNIVIPYDKARSEAMTLALTGATGVGQFTDLSGERVLAAYTYVPELGTGLEIKMAMAEIQRPYLVSGVLIAGASSVVILACIFLFVRISRPVLQELEKHRMLTEAVVDSAQDIIFTIDARGFIRLMNPAGVQNLGYERTEIEGRDFALLFDVHDDATVAVISAIREQHLNIAPDSIVLLRRKSGSVFPSSITCGQMRLAESTQTTIVLHDLTALKEAESMIRRLTHKMIEIKDREQDEISRELHDTLGTSLVWLKLQVQRLFGGRSEDTEVKNLLHSFDETIDTTRNLSHSLSPIAIEKLGLAVMLHRLVERAEKIGSAHVSLNIGNLERRFSAKETFHIFRMMQEALNNAVRHAQATEIKIEGYPQGDKLVFRVTDNGVGFDPPAQHEGLGLSLIAERARLLNGKAHFLSEKNKGTEVTIELPRA